VTFSNVLEEMRRELALQYLQDATLSASRIAWLLGFQESSAFTHAFKLLDGADAFWNASTQSGWFCRSKTFSRVTCKTP